MRHSQVVLMLLVQPDVVNLVHSSPAVHHIMQHHDSDIGLPASGSCRSILTSCLLAS